MAAGFTTIQIKDGNGNLKTMAVYQDVSGNIYPAPVGTDAVGDILGLANTPIYNFAPVPVVYTGATLTRSNDSIAYAFGDAIYASTASSQVVTYTIQSAKATNQASTILRAGLLKSGTSITNAIFRLHLFNVQPTLFNGDNGAWLSTVSNYVGSMDITIDKAGSDKSIGIGVPVVGSTISNTPVSGQNYYYYELEARAAYAPGPSETFIPWIEVQ